MNRKNWGIVSCGCFALILGACSNDHMALSKPAPGYSWEDPSSLFDFKTVWKSDRSHPDHAHIHSGVKEGDWQPDDGYGWTTPDVTSSLQVKWTPGVSSKAYPHTYTAETEGQYYPTPGYDWVNLGHSMAVKWSPGAHSGLMPHMYAATQEGYWLPDCGYRIEKQKDGTLVAEAVADYAGVLREGSQALEAYNCATDADNGTMLRMLCAGASVYHGMAAYDKASRGGS